MAKKKEAKLVMNLSGNFDVDVPDSNLKIFEKGFKGAELGLSVNVLMGDEIGMFSIYADNFKNGDMKVSKINNNKYHFEISGQVEVDLDLSIMQEMFDFLSSHQDVPVEVTCVYDQDVNDYFIDGDEDKSLNIGTAKLV